MNEIQGQSDGVTSQTGLRTSRRRALEIIGSTLIAAPVLGLTACGGGEEAAAPTSAAPASMPEKAPAEPESMTAAVEDQAAEMVEEAEKSVAELQEAVEEAADEAGAAMEEAASEVIASDGMAQVDENGAQALGLGYRHDASTVDAAVQTRYQAGQMCSNCVLYQGGDAAWGGCPLFAGQQVKATGWCSAYAAAS